MTSRRRLQRIGRLAKSPLEIGPFGGGASWHQAAADAEFVAARR